MKMPTAKPSQAYPPLSVRFIPAVKVALEKAAKDDSRPVSSLVQKPRRASLTQADIDSDTRLCLDEAARLAFPDGTVSTLTLRAEAARGRLTIFRIGKKYYTTLAEIDRMGEKCRVLPRVRISTSDVDQAASPDAGHLDNQMKLARAALEASVKLLKGDCRKPK